MEAIRIRVAFEDGHILSKSQRSEGLKRSWLLLKQHPDETISDLTSYILHTFDLFHSCPNGILLSMDDFVLPQFESTSILKDKDVIRVKRRGCMLSEIDKVGDGAKLIEEHELVEKQPVVTNVPLLANEEFEKEAGGHQSESEEDEDNQLEETLHVENLSGENAVSKKRKASKKLQSSKKKKKCHTDPKDTGNDSHVEHDRRGLHSGGSIDKKKKASDVKSKAKAASTPISAEKKGSGQFQENGIGCANMPQTPDETRKIPSRSARRKKAKRQWLRELLKAEKKELVTSNMELKQTQSLPENDTHKGSIEDQVQNQTGKAANEIVADDAMGTKADNEIVADDEIVPIVIRPGHIRFEPLGKDHPVQKNKVPMETFQWNGITSKKKGQKWGTEKFSSRSAYKDSNKEFSEMITVEKVKHPNDPIDFDKLAPFASFPKEGDVIAYRLLELSSTWTPELSPFRVGKTSRYDPESGKVLLAPVSEYPVTFEKSDEEQPDNSLYGENGSLEIDFSSLVDVRIVKLGNLAPAKPVTGMVHEGSAGIEVSKSTVVPSNDDKRTDAGPTPEKEVNAWDEISEAISAKKVQLIKENGWNKESSGRGPWSFRGLRSSALGPTMAILRARNDI